MTGTTVEQAGDSDESRAVAARRARWDALRTLWTESRLKRVRQCRLAVTDLERGVSVRVSNGGAAGLTGVQTCGSTWACPVCSAKIASHRAGEVAAVIEGHLRDHPDGDVLMVTLTVQHKIGHRLEHLWPAVSTAWHQAVSGRGWADDKALYGVAGYVRVVEVTYGKNGWHIHVHALLLTTRKVWRVEQLELQRSMLARWKSGLVACAFTASSRRGVDVRRMTGSGPLGRYFTKATYEVTGAGHKTPANGNVTPFGLLARIVEDGDADDLDAWHEWERVSRGKRQLTWSRGLRAKYLTAPELEDQAVAEEATLDGETVAELTAGGYRALAMSGLVPTMLGLAEAGPALLWGWLDARGIMYEIPDAGRVSARAG